MIITRAIFLPAALRVEGETHDKANIASIPLHTIGEMAIRDALSTFANVAHLSFRQAFDSFRLPLLLISALAFLVTLSSILVKKMASLLSLPSKIGTDDAVIYIFSSFDRQLIFIVPVVLYLLEYAIWNPSLDKQLLDSDDEKKEIDSHNDGINVPNASRTEIRNLSESQSRGSFPMHAMDQIGTKRPSLDETFERIRRGEKMQMQSFSAPELSSFEKTPQQIKIHQEVSSLVKCMPKLSKEAIEDILRTESESS